MEMRVDEVRIANTVHTAAWIQARHLSMSDSFVDYHPVEQF
jgi:hypothetical protein